MNNLMIATIIFLNIFKINAIDVDIYDNILRFNNELKVESITATIEYGDLEEYMSFEFSEYDEEKVIEYILELNKKMKNCIVELEEEYSNDRYLIFEVTEIETTECEQNIAIAWEKNKSSGGFVLEEWFAGIDGFIYNNVLIIDSGTGGDRVKNLYNLDNNREHLYLDSLNVTKDPVNIDGTAWLLYQSVPYDYNCSVEVEPQSEIHMYNINSKMTVILRKAIDNIMWTYDYDGKDNKKFEIIKWIQEEDYNIKKVSDGKLEFDKLKYNSIIENKLPLVEKKQYFKYSNRNYENPYCEVSYFIESEFLCMFELPIYHGVGIVFDNWSKSNFPDTTSDVIKIENSSEIRYIYAFKDELSIVICERLVENEIIKYDKILTVFEKH